MPTNTEDFAAFFNAFTQLAQKTGMVGFGFGSFGIGEETTSSDDFDKPNMRDELSQKGSSVSDLNVKLQQFNDEYITVDELLDNILDELTQKGSSVSDILLTAVSVVRDKVKYLNDFNFEATAAERNRINKRLLLRRVHEEGEY